MPTANVPHKGAKFEGYYTKFDLASGSKLIIIMCSVPNAPNPNRRNNITITYCPRRGKVWQHEIWPDKMLHGDDKRHSGTLSSHEDCWSITFTDESNCTQAVMGTNIARSRINTDFSNTKFVRNSSTIADSSMMYLVEYDTLKINAHTRDRVPWQESRMSTPEGWLTRMPLPLHWHVNSLASRAAISLRLPQEANLADEDEETSAIAHEEKNWANGFPLAHMWVQARVANELTESCDRQPSLHRGRGICLAGGRTMGMVAYLVGYRNDEQGVSIDFRPPFALDILGFSPFMTVKRDWEERSFELSVQNLRHKLVVKAKAPAESFFVFSAPTPEGFRVNSMAQSMKATVNVELYQRTGFMFGWTSICKDNFVEASLEFGGDYYPEKATHLKVG